MGGRSHKLKQKIHVRYFSKPPSRFRAGGMRLLCHLCNDPWPALLPLKEGREKWQPLPPCKAALKLCEHLGFHEFWEGNCGHKTIAICSDKLPALKYHGCNPRISSGAGTESPPDLLQATFSRVPMMCKESHATGRWATYPRAAGAVWATPPGIGSHCWPGLRAVTHYWFLFSLLTALPFPSKCSFSERLCLNKIITI